jgi:hypothetical protein
MERATPRRRHTYAHVATARQTAESLVDTAESACRLSIDLGRLERAPDRLAGSHVSDATVRRLTPPDRPMIRLLAVVMLLTTSGGEGNDPTAERVASPAQVRPAHSLYGRRRPRSSRAAELPDDARAALSSALEDSERVDSAVDAVGCTLVLTDRRLLVVRDGASFRPRSGVRSWPLDRGLTLRLGQVRRDTSRLVIDHAGRSASVFLTAAQIDDAEALIATIRQRIYAGD